MAAVGFILASLSGGSGPTPLSLQRLAVCLQSVVQLLECPVCLETIPSPAYQCCNGHILCGECRARADRCPVCRVHLGSRGRCLLADKLYALLTSTFLRECHTKKRKIQPENKNVPKLKLKSRLSKQSEQEQEDSVKINEISMIRNRLLSSSEKITDEVDNDDGCLYYCPSGECDNKTMTAGDLTQHLQSPHDGPLIQYFPKAETATLHLPLCGTIAVNCHGLRFFVRAAPHKTVGCLLFWVWVAAEEIVASLYRFSLGLAGGRNAEGSVLPLTISESEIMLTSLSEHCLILDDIDMEKNNSVDITIMLQHNNDKTE